jgi:hypothetical protein
MFLIKLAAVGFAAYAAYAWYQGRRSQVPICLTVSGAAFAFWFSRIAIRWIQDFQSS